jgi:predicted nucleic acid-binding protein
MTPAVVLDSGPLALLFQKQGIQPADECREWLRRHLSAGARVVVPEIVDYELRRELLRLDNAAAVAALDAFIGAEADRYLPLTTSAMRRAAALWAEVRKKGVPTAHPHALDGDVILCAQILSAGLRPTEFVVATTNAVHLSRLVPAQDWSSI